MGHFSIFPHSEGSVSEASLYMPSSLADRALTWMPQQIVLLVNDFSKYFQSFYFILEQCLFLMQCCPRVRRFCVVFMNDIMHHIGLNILGLFTFMPMNIILKLLSN